MTTQALTMMTVLATRSKQQMTPLPPKEIRRQKWKEQYREEGPRANLRTSLRDMPSREYLRGEWPRIEMCSSVVKRAVGSYQKALNHVTDINPVKKIINLGTGVGLLEARPGNMAAFAAENGYTYVGCDFADEALERCKNRTETSLRRKGLSDDHVAFSVCEFLDFLKLQPDSSASVISLFQELQHFDTCEIVELATEIKRVLHRAGLICVEFPLAEKNKKRLFNLKRTRLHHLSFIKEVFNPYSLGFWEIKPIFEEEQSFFGIFGNRQYYHS